MTPKRDSNSIVVGYVRVSTENQLENYSIEEQSGRIRSFCAAKGWKLLRIYTDGGYSGGNTDRPALQQMLRDTKTSKIDAVVVYKLDRLSRSQKDTLTLIEDGFLAGGVDFVSINENFDTSSPFGRAMIGILSVFAQLEKDQITERFLMGRIGRGKAGYFHGGGNAPTGYHYQDGSLIVNEYEALAVQQIYKSFLAGKSVNTIWHEMQNAYTGTWSAQKVLNILKNSLYVGCIKFAGAEYQGKHEPLVSQEDFDAARHLLGSFEREAGKTSSQKNPFRAGYLLSGLVVCKRCGARYSANHGFYKCYSRAKSSPKFIVDPTCKNDNWGIDALDKIVVNTIRQMLASPDTMHEIITAADGKPHVVDEEKLRKRLVEIDRQIERMVDLYQVGGIPMDIISKNIHTLSEERQRLGDEIENTVNASLSQKEYFLRAGRDFELLFDNSTTETQRQIISNMIEAIIIDGQSIDVRWRL
ncbi:MAG TPA: recombinase family protein [Clostridia bacterium]|nr:recombinase family protein [Clostridia bacterium]